jgi:hypothetical protein
MSSGWSRNVISHPESCQYGLALEEKISEEGNGNVMNYGNGLLGGYQAALS